MRSTSIALVEDTDTKIEKYVQDWLGFIKNQSLQAQQPIISVRSFKIEHRRFGTILCLTDTEGDTVLRVCMRSSRVARVFGKTIVGKSLEITL